MPTVTPNKIRVEEIAELLRTKYAVFTGIDCMSVIERSSDIIFQVDMIGSFDLLSYFLIIKLKTFRRSLSPYFYNTCRL